MYTSYLLLEVCVLCCIYKAELQDEDSPFIFPVVEDIPERDCTTAEGKEGSCRPTELCVFRFDSVSQSEFSSCKLNKDEHGVCCPKKPPPTRGTGASRPIVEDPVIMPDISLNELDSAGEEGLSIVQQVEQLEIELKRKGLFVKRGTKEFHHQFYFGAHRQNLSKLTKDGLTGVEATLKLVKTFQLDSAQSREGLRRFSLMETIIRDTCPHTPRCPPSKYRSFDASCNNLEKASWGKSFTAFGRLLPPRYFDGINAPRISYDGGPLPSSREVSSRCHPHASRSSKRLTMLFAHWAEFLGHDLALTGITTTYEGEIISCCDEEIQHNPKLLHPACLPIYVPTNDPFYSQYNVTCMNFVRSLPAPRPDCNFGPREQLNQMTSFIDGSMIYGLTENDSNSIRSFEKGMMKTVFNEKEELMSVVSNHSEYCAMYKVRPNCFIAGDLRANLHPLATSMYTLFLREHNRIAEKLSRLNKGWNDEILYREARRLVGAEIQHITYTEFLPLLLGKKVMSSFKLSPKLAGYSYDYDSKLNPSIVNAFATAAFRMGHSLVQDTFYFMRGERIEERFNFSENFFNSQLLLRPSATSKLLKALAFQPSQEFDHFVSDQITNHLFRAPRETHGLDLIAFDIQRGRDHGLPGYNEWREHCSLPRIRNFEELRQSMSQESARNFSRIYRNVDDVDLFPAGLSETPLPDAVIGPTFACIIAEQFRRLKQGDRFWYENGGMESSFNEGQLTEIRKVTMSRIICDNTDVDEVQLVAFLKPEKWNPVLPCSSDIIPKIDFFSWKNEPVWS